jgi:radical SAM superfamily enzyme YgiQ (UPF0313 family)
VGFYNVATPFPGTPLYDLVKENGWLKVTDFDKYDTVIPIFETPTLSMKELREIHEQAFHHFYLRPTYFVNNLRKGRLLSLSTVLAHLVGAIKLKLSSIVFKTKKNVLA